MSTVDSSCLCCELKVPFTNNYTANIAYTTLRVDPEPRKGAVSKHFTVKDNYLFVNITAKEARLLRVAVNSLMDHLSLVLQTMEQFTP